MFYASLCIRCSITHKITPSHRQESKHQECCGHGRNVQLLQQKSPQPSTRHLQTPFHPSWKSWGRFSNLKNNCIIFAPETNTNCFKSVSISAPCHELSFAWAAAGARRASSQFDRRQSGEALLVPAEGGGAFSVTFRGPINLFHFIASTRNRTHLKN